MRLATFETGHETRVGVVNNAQVLDVGRAIGLLREGKLEKFVPEGAARHLLAASPAPRDMMELLEQGEGWLRALDEAATALMRSLDTASAPEGLLTRLEGARLRAPLAKPGKIVCLGRNYASHSHEQGKEPPQAPIYFLKSANTICGPGDPVVLPVNSQQVDFEAEFAVVMGKRGRRIPETKAYEYVAGYMILNDVSARDMQAADKQWFRGKSCDTFAPTGPWIVTRDEVPDPHRLQISLTLNGQTMQDSNTSYLIFKIPYLISYLSQSLTWEVGDVVSTGTPGGVGVHRKPPVFLKPGDTVSITVEQIGTLTNPVVGSE